LTVAPLRRVPLLILGSAVAALAAWRAACVLSGPDIDTDAYAHHMIARAILADPRDLAVHWVWLPLFHYAQVPLVALGGTMQDVRWANVALSAALPILLFSYVNRTARTGRADIPPAFIALFAALVAALCPIAMQMGTTAQPEPLFALLMLGVAITFQERRYGSTTAMLGAAVLLRYEAWAALAAVAASLAVDAPRERATTRASARWLVVVVPTALIFVWAGLRRPFDGRWFGFLGETRQFATDATHGGNVVARGVDGLARDLFYYPVWIAYRVLGPTLPLAALGLGRMLRQQGVRFASVLGACLAFVSLTWILRSSLGLDRHFVAAIPLYAASAAHGVGVVADATMGLLRWVPRMNHANRARRVAAGVALFVGFISLAGLMAMAVVWMGFWQDSIRRGWPDRAAAGAYLRTLPDESTIFCDEATIEILSGVDRRRFDRHWLDDPHTWRLVEDSARERGVAYVATWTRKLADHEREGTLVFQAGHRPGEPQSGVAILKLQTDDRHASR
jgi:hypothetical protein